VQSDPQAIPDGVEATLPVPAPALLTVSWKTRANEALTDRVDDIATVQVVADALSHPVQPVKAQPADGAAVRVTVVPLE
jgi:hypothetical protein